MTARFLSDTATRIEHVTPEHVNQRIQWTTEAAILHFAQDLDNVEARLQQLKKEWDIERALQTSAGFVISATLLLGLFKKRWRILSIVSSGFLILHAVNGWCPPVPILRRLGVRTAREINREKYALKAVRGDFSGAGPAAPGEPAEKARIAAGAVSLKSDPMQFVNVAEYEETLNVPR